MNSLSRWSWPGVWLYVVGYWFSFAKTMTIDQTLRHDHNP
jgi:hypothetical protein